MILTGVETQEAAKDATCWTTVRMMDAHFAGRPILDEVASLRIEACKTLVYHLWRRASLQVPASRQFLEADDIDVALPADLRQPTALLNAAKPVVGADTVVSVMNRDYERITENKRYIISLCEEAILGTGLFAGRHPDVLPLSTPAIDHLTASATLVTTRFLVECGRQAASAGHASIRAEDVQAAFAKAIDELQITSTAEQPETKVAYVDADLLKLTRELIANKVVSLRVWNAGIWKGVTDIDGHQRDLMNRFISIPFDAESFAELRIRLRQYADYIALGVQPMQRNLFASYINAHPEELGNPALLGTNRKSFADLPWTMNAIDDLYPRDIAANGDVTVYLMPNPAQLEHVSSTRLKLLDYELDAVRDTTLHWSIMQEAWASPDARPADPFALEILADRLSELALLFVRACNDIAKEDGKQVIDKSICDRVLHGYEFAQPHRLEASWIGQTLSSKLVTDVGPTPFIDATKDSGFPQVRQLDRLSVEQIQDGGQTDLSNLMGSGVAVGDFDGDGRPDLFLPGDGGNRLLRNLGNGKFADVTRELGITDTRLDDAHQAIFVDYDNDGRLDLFIVHAHSPSRLFHQKPDGHFEDVTASCGIVTGDYAHDVVWFDYDNDGLLDCYVGTYGGFKPSLDGRNGGKNRLFHNLGNGHFEDVTDRSGLGSTGWTLATAAFDYDHDGYPDVFVGNDYGRSELFHNNRDGTFTECGGKAGVDDRGSSMNASIVDIDGDGWMDLYVTQIDMFSKSIGFVFPTDGDHINVNKRILGSTFYLSGNKLFRNRHDGTFQSVEEQLFQPGDRGWSWSANFFDYANAGHDDCYITNGWLNGTPAANQRHQFFVRDGDRFFLYDHGDQSYASNARGCVAADLRNNGHMDLVVNDYGSPPHLLLNQSRDHHAWLKVALHGVRTNRFGIGALVHVVAGGHGQWKQVSCGSNYLSQEDTTLTFGLGDADHADAIEIVWPGNHAQKLTGPIAVNQLVGITEEASPAPDAGKTSR